MKTVFDIIEDITYKKPKYTLLPSDDCPPFMVQKWLSFVDPAYCNLMNELYNMRSGGFIDNQQFYDFMKCVIPKKYVGKIKYIKKTKKIDESKQDGVIGELANILEISRKEAREMIKLDSSILDLYKDDLKSFKKID